MHPLNLLRRHWVELDGLMVPADSVNAFGHGHGHGLGSRAVWTPEKWGTDRLVDYTADDVVVVGGEITQWNDQAGLWDILPLDATTRADYVASGIGGKPSARFILDSYRADPIIYASTRWSVFMVYSDSAVGAERYLFDTETGRALYTPDSPSGQAQYYDGTYRDLGAAARAPTSEVLVVDDTAVTLYREGISIGASACVARQIGDRFGFGSNFVGSGQLQDCLVARMTVLKRVATADDIAKWAKWSLGRYGK